MNQQVDVKWEEAQKMGEEISKSDFFNRFAYKYTWLSGESTIVYPVTIYDDEIVIQLAGRYSVSRKGRSAAFRKLLSKLKRKHTRRMLGRYCANDGSCPEAYHIFFNEKYEWFQPSKKAVKKSKAA